MIGLSLKRPVTIFMAVCLLAVLGYISYSRLGRDLLPDIAYPSLTVTTRYEGAGPQEVEEFITKPLESSLATVKGKRRISSISRENLSLITIEFQWGEDMQIATLNVREKLDQARFRAGFPQDADRPNILRWDPSSKPIVGLAVSGDAPLLEIREAVNDVIKPRLEQLDGVAFAQISGDVERVIDIEVDREKLTLFGISLTEIASAVQFSNANIAGGTIRKGRYRYTLRTLGEFLSVDEINTVVVARRNGADIRVQDIAVVNDTIKDREAMATVDGVQAVGLLIYKEAGANTIEATQLVKELVDELSQENSEYRITLAFEEAKFIEQALNNVWVSLIFGGMFAFLVLVLFLSDLKSPIFIFISIPIAIITTLVLMFFFDLSLNIMSLGGLALGVGMLVDNSIVVLENIYRYREKGETAMRAAYLGAREVAVPVAASTLTTVAVFFPIVYLKGVAGALFGEQALTVTFSLGSSLLVSLTVLPLLTALSTILEGRDTLPARLKPMAKTEREQNPRGFVFWRWWEFLIAGLAIFYVASYFKQDWWTSIYIVVGLLLLPIALFLTKWIVTFVLALLFQLFTFALMLIKSAIQFALDYFFLPIFNFCFHSFERVYHAVLLWSLDRKLVTMSLAIGLMAVTYMAGRELQMELMPKSATGQFSIDAKLAPGTALEVTAEVIENLEKRLLEDEAVDVVFSQIGASEANLAQLLKDSGTNTANISVKLNESHISLEEVYRLSDVAQAFADEVPGMKVSVKESESSFEDLLASEGGGGLVVQIEADLFEKLFEANEAIFEMLQQDDRLLNVRTTLTRDYPQMEITLLRDTIQHYGLDNNTIGTFISGGMRGEMSTEYKEFDKSIDVRVRFTEEDRENFDNVLASTVQTPTGTSVPLSELINAEIIFGTKEIRRINQRRVALVSANLQGQKISEVIPSIQAALDELQLPPGVVYRIAGEQEGIQNSFGQLLMAFLLSAVLVYMIMAGQFESLRFPFVVIFTLPMGLVGTVFMLFTFDQSINIMSLIGLVVLSGIVVNDAIVKVDFINQSRARGSSIREAILEASRVRLRPILMTTATTVLGLVPMASGLVPWFMNLPFIQPLVASVDGLLANYNVILLSELFSPRGAEIQQPLALVVIGGLTMATLLTLILIPNLYELLASGKQTTAPADDAQATPPVGGMQPEEEPT
jgi:HAE1 family hydrophobic/amphiphilic exporter-1